MFKDIKFSHAFQPIIDINSKKTISYEVLLRGINNEPPGFIFKKIEKSNMMFFDQYNREDALKLAASLGVTCSINLNFTPGSILFKDGYYPLLTLEKAKSLGFKAKQLVFEITESELIQDYNLFLDILNKLHGKGVVIAIDDFGAGYSGLNMLADIQPDIIKIDMSLLRNIDTNGPRQSIVKAINNVCLDLGIDTLAEGVETIEEYKFLKSIGISIYQGFLFAKPGFETLPKPFFP
jgi:EAL domain-containing protein (putative c-di-GMP-specific phosphodiesterase class I)